MLNRVTLMGKLCDSPELKKTADGTSVTSFTLANKTYGDKVNYIDCVAWRETAEQIARYRKDNLLVVEGYLQNRSYTKKDGTQRTITELVVCREFFGTEALYEYN